MEPVVALGALGFSELEARLYCELLRQSPLTGYRLSQIVAKAPANTYQALKTLAQKGGVVVSERLGEGKTYAAVSAEELMAGLAQSFEERRQAALTSLHGLRRPASEERVYQMQSVSQVLERARGMIVEAREIVLFHFLPDIHELMKPCLLEARERGVRLCAFDPGQAALLEQESVRLSVSGSKLIVVVDGRQQLIARFSQDHQRLLDGVWSDSAFLSATYHSAMMAEIRLAAIQGASSADQT